MFAEERQEQIKEQIQNKGAVTTTGLMECFHVSIETIRRDLLQMERAGLLRRVHGGAVVVSEVRPFQIRSDRESVRGAQKASLAEKAMELISENDVIGIDSGSSTALFFARALKEHFRHLTVVTCSLDVFEILHGYADFQVILCGGYFHEKEHYFYGTPAIDTMSQLFLQKAFICPAAISLEYGLYDHQPEVYLTQKKMMASSDEIIILADSSKFEKKALMKFDDMHPKYQYVTDYEFSDGLMQLYQQNGIHIVKGNKPFSDIEG